jgi:hypothetical protein
VRIHVSSIIQQMSAEVRKQAEDEASKKGMTLEQFVQDQLTVQLAEEEIAVNAAAVRFDRWDIRGDANPRDGGTRVGVGIGGRF